MPGTPDPPDAEHPGNRFTLFHRHGESALAFATLQPGMAYHSDEFGYAAYRRRAGRTIFLGDPVCPPDHLRAFLERCNRAHPHALYMQVRWDTASALRELGLCITPVGVENAIDTHAFSLAGKRMADLRHYRNRARAAGVTVRELPDSIAARAELRPISDAWLAAKSRFANELEFLARPWADTPEPGVRLFTAAAGGNTIAFVILDPMFQENRITGYAVSILRHLPRSPKGAVDAIVLRALDILAEEGVPELNLGVSPFHRIEDLATHYGRGNRAVFGLYRLLRRWGDPIYHFRGLSFHKSRYRAREIPVFTALPRRGALWALFASARACRML